MEGRAIARPNGPGQHGSTVHTAASMEGRAIARPNQPEAEATDFAALRFNGGPGNCPAKPSIMRLPPQTGGMYLASMELAGQLPGQTARQIWWV